MTWVAADTGLYGGPVTAVAALSSQPSVVYAGTKEDETYVSADGGNVWNRLGASATGHYVAGMTAGSVNGRTIVGKAVYGEGLFLSDDGGTTWKTANRGLRSRLLSCLAAAADAPQVMVIGTADAGLYVSHDGGHTWKRTGRTVLGGGITCVAMARDGLTVFAGTQDDGLFVSRDGGGAWTKIALPFGSEPLVTAVAIDHMNDVMVAVCASGSGVGISTDGGRTWKRSPAGSLPSDCAAVQFIPNTGSGLVVGTQSGVLCASPDGMAWHTAQTLPDGGHVYALTLAGDRLLAATSHGIMTSSDGTVWQASSTGITNLTLTDLAVSPVQPDTLFAATDDGIYRSLDAGESWFRSSASHSVLSVLVLPRGGTVLGGTDDGRVLRSVDGGQTWRAATRGVPGMKVTSLISIPGQPETVCAGTDDGFAISMDAGQTWVGRNIGLAPKQAAGEPTSRIEVAALIADPQHRGTIVLALLGQGLYISSDEGLHWTSMRPGPETPWIDSLAWDASAGRIYAGTDTAGVAVSQDAGATWSASGKGLSSVLSVAGAVGSIATTVDGTVYAGTAARGVGRSIDGGVTWQRINSGLPAIGIRRVVAAGTHIYALTAHRLVRLSSQ